MQSGQKLQLKMVLLPLASLQNVIRKVICKDKEQDYRIRRHNSLQQSQEDVCLHWPHPLRTDDSGPEIVTSIIFIVAPCILKST